MISSAKAVQRPFLSARFWGLELGPSVVLVLEGRTSGAPSKAHINMPPKYTRTYTHIHARVPPQVPSQEISSPHKPHFKRFISL